MRIQKWIQRVKKCISNRGEYLKGMQYTLHIEQTSYNDGEFPKAYIKHYNKTKMCTKLIVMYCELNKSNSPKTNTRFNCIP